MEKISWDRVVEFISLLALLVTAWATRGLWLSRRQQDAATLPTVTIKRGQTLRRSNRPMEVAFAIDPAFEPIWRVTSIRVKPFWLGKIISHWKTKESNPLGGYHYIPHGWRRLIIYDPPRSDGSFIVTPDAPPSFTLIFNLSLRASSNDTSRFPVRIKIRD